MRKRRILSILTALTLCLSLLPATALAGSYPNCSGNCNHEAAIGTTHYDTIGEALKVAGGESGNGGTVVLLKDGVTLVGTDDVWDGTNYTKSTVIYKDVILDLNEKTLKCNAYVAISVRPNAHFTIKNGTFENVYNNQWACAIEASKSDDVGGNGCTITLTDNVTVKAKYAAVYGVGYTTIEVFNSAVEGEYAIYGAGPTNKVTLREATVTGSKFGVYQGPYDPNYFLNEDVAGSVYEIYSSTIEGGDDYAGVCINNYITNVATGNHTLLVQDSQITGGSGIETKRTNVTIKGENTVITATGDEGMNPDGDPVSSGYALAAAYYQSEAGAMGTLNIEGGTFNGAIGIQEPVETETEPTSPATLTISGGKFTDDVSEYVMDGMMQDDNGNIVEKTLVTSVTLNKSTLTLTVGDSETLTATVEPDNATDKDVTWSSDNSDFATVDSNGKVTAVGAGTATIIAKAGEKEATCTVTVAPAPVPVSSISLNQTQLDLYVGDTTTLTATVEPNNATDKAVTWTSNNDEVATVDKNGVVTAVGEGTATITAKAGDMTATCEIVVTRRECGISAAPSELDFGNAYPAYQQPGAQTVTITNTGNQTVTLDSLAASSYFEIGELSLTQLAPDDTATFTVRPKADLPIGNYSETIYVTSSNDDVSTDVTASFAVLERPASSGGTAPVRDIAVDGGSHGDVEVWPEEAKQGTTVTITATPDKGYEVAEVIVTDEKGKEITVTDKGDGKYTFMMPNSDVTIEVTFQAVSGGSTSGGDLTITAPAGWVNPYTDVAANAWYYNAVGYASANGLMGGVGNNAFAPSGTMNRAMVWTVIGRLAGQTITGATWAADAQAWAVAQGVSDGTNPDGSVTREELVTMLYRYAGSPAMNVPELALIGGYPDSANVSAWAQNAFAWAISKGIIEGRDGKLAAGESVTRAEAATILARFHLLTK